MAKILVLHGPNLNLLGKRDPEQYGAFSLEELNRRICEYGEEMGLVVETFQSNLEGELVSRLQQAAEEAVGVVFNPGGYSHTSVAIRDAVQAIDVPVVEVHLSNIQAREEFRRKSLIAPVCRGSIAGFGLFSYLLGMKSLLFSLQEEQLKE